MTDRAQQAADAIDAVTVLTPLQARRILVEYTKDDLIAAIATGHGGSQPWTQNTLSPLEADWSLNGGVGTWTFAGGVISHTVDDEDAVITYDTLLPSTEYVIEAEIRLPTGQDSLTTMQAILCAGNQIPNNGAAFAASADLVGSGAFLMGAQTGDGAINGNVFVDGSSNAPNAPGFPTAIAQGEWHTLRAVVGAMWQLVYLDGDLLLTNEQATGGNQADAATTPPTYPAAVMLGAVGLADFRNVKVWTRTLPT